MLQHEIRKTHAKSQAHEWIEELSLSEIVGKGGFGVVYKGSWKGSVAAVKVSCVRTNTHTHTHCHTCRVTHTHTHTSVGSYARLYSREEYACELKRTQGVWGHSRVVCVCVLCCIVFRSCTHVNTSVRQ